MKYYIYFNEETKMNIKYYSNMDEAIKEFDLIRDDPKRVGAYYFGITSDAVTPDSGYCFDYIHMNKKSKEEFIFLISDYENYLKKQNYAFEKDVSLLIDYYKIEWRYCSSICNNGCYIPVRDEHNNYIDNKILFIKPKAGRGFPKDAINEIYVKGQGWRNAKEVIVSKERIFISRVNVKYIDDKGHIGQMDISPADTIRMLKPLSKPYQLIVGLKRLSSGKDYYGIPAVAATYDTKSEAVDGFYNYRANYIEHDDQRCITNNGKTVFYGQPEEIVNRKRKTR